MTAQGQNFLSTNCIPQSRCSILNTCHQSRPIRVKGDSEYKTGMIHSEQWCIAYFFKRYIPYLCFIIITGCSQTSAILRDGDSIYTTGMTRYSTELTPGFNIPYPYYSIISCGEKARSIGTKSKIFYLCCNSRVVQREKFYSRLCIPYFYCFVFAGACQTSPIHIEGNLTTGAILSGYSEQLAAWRDIPDPYSPIVTSCYQTRTIWVELDLIDRASMTGERKQLFTSRCVPYFYFAVSAACCQ